MVIWNAATVSLSVLDTISDAIKFINIGENCHNDSDGDGGGGVDNLRTIERMDGKIGLVWFSGFDFILLDFFL